MGRLGADRREMLAHGGLREEMLGNPDGRVPLEAVYAAIESATASTGDPMLGVHVAQLVTVEDLDAQAFLMMTSVTMGDAIERLNRFSEAFVSGERYRWLVTGDAVTLEFILYGPDRPAHHQVAELVFYDLARNSDRLFGADVLPVELRFTHQPTAGVDYASAFGARVRFGQPRYEAQFSPALLDVKLRHASPVMAPLVDRYIAGLLDEPLPSGSIVGRVLEMIDGALETGPPTLADTASALHMSPRSLQRQLRGEGTSLRELVDRAREAKARSLVSAGVPLAEIAYLLGYADQTVLHRTFRRWTGQTPTEYRVCTERDGAGAGTAGAT